MPFPDDSDPHGTDFQHLWIRDGEIASDLHSNSAPEPRYSHSSMQQTAPQHGHPQPSAPQYGQQWAPSSHPAAGGAPRGVSKPLLWTSIAAAGAILIGAVAVAFAVLDNDPQTSAASTAASAPQAPQSTSQDWFAAVCRKGTFTDGGQTANTLPGADATGFCAGKNGSAVSIGSYSSTFLLENDVARFYSPSYATTVDDQGRTWAFVSVPANKSDLAPLEQFGFVIH